MPTGRKQFNIVLDAVTEEIIFQLVAQTHDNPAKLIKELIGTHPRVVEQAKLSGLTPDPASVKHGGKREKKAVLELPYEPLE